MRIAVAGFLHETNSFAPNPADLTAFVSGSGYAPIQRGAAMLTRMRGINLAVAGMLDHAEAAGWDVVPILWCGAVPSAPVTTEAWQVISAEILQGLADCGPLDGILLDLHGAMMTEDLPDGEGALLQAVREIRPETPMAVALDLHGNITREMFDAADLLVGYRTYPHIDQADTGRRTAEALGALIADNGKWHKSMVQMDYLIPIAWQYTGMEPARGLYQMTRALPAGVATASLFMGFPAADFAGCGPSGFAYGPDKAAVDAHAKAMESAVYAAEPAFAGESFAPEAAVREAIRLAQGAKRPVVIADTQDNPGAGGSSDTTGMLRALVACDAQNAAIGNLYDPAAAKAAHAAGLGAKLQISLGGRSGLAGDAPFAVEAEVRALTNGKVKATGPFYGGNEIDLGLSACLRVGGTDVIVTSGISQMADREFYRTLGVVPEEKAILVNKSSVHFRADFEPIAEVILVATAPGAMPLCPSVLPWKHLRQGIRLRPLGPEFGGDATTSTAAE